MNQSAKPVVMTEGQRIEAATVEFINSLPIAIVCTLVAKDVKRDEWDCDEWRVSISAARINTTFPFYTGLGLRVIGKTGIDRKPAQDGTTYARRELAAWTKRNAKPVAPSYASIVSSMLRDGEAIDQSFTDWCSEFGMDEDSRKALDTYTECCEMGRKLRKIFTREQLAQLSTIVQDY